MSDQARNLCIMSIQSGNDTTVEGYKTIDRFHSTTGEHAGLTLNGSSTEYEQPGDVAKRTIKHFSVQLQKVHKLV